MFHRVGEFVVRRARLVLVVTVLVLAGAAVLGTAAFSKLQGGGFDDPGAESTRAARTLAAKFGDQTNVVLLVDAGRPVDQVATAGTTLTQRMAHEPGLSGVASYWTTHSPAMRSE
ncbi:MAG TPA: MMPL family transporter, partial [Kribbellaceae bacterium]